jgi:rSAM/selenodomain-associated transferase 1
MIRDPGRRRTLRPSAPAPRTKRGAAALESRSSTASALLVVFARAPRPGEAKTRLVPLLGPQGAAALQAQLTERALATARAAALGAVELRCAPDAEEPFFRACAQRYGVRLAAQGGGDLGARMLRACAAALADHEHVLLIGSDCPAMTTRYLRRAQRALRDGRDAVLGPAADGGYVLLGLARLDPRLFAGIEWGTERVLAQTRARLAALGWRWLELPALWDVDRPEDYEKLVCSGLLPRRGDCAR